MARNLKGKWITIWNNYDNISYMKTITICGSMTFAKEMDKWKSLLQKHGFEVFVPGGLSDLSSYKESGSHEGAVRRKVDNDFINEHYRYIKQSDGILIINEDKNGISNYIGGNSLMEIGFAFTLNRDIFLLNPIPDVNHKSEIEAMSPIVIDNDVRKIIDYYNDLSKAYLSSESILKIKATSFGFRKMGIKCDVIGKKTTSGVNEQPQSIDESYSGAENRLVDLKNQIKNKPYEYLVSIEAGIENLHKKHNVHGHTVCIIEDNSGKRGVSITTEYEVPKEMTDLVPIPYADLGILVQEKFGIKNKDPYLYLSKGKISRGELMINTVVNAFVTIS